MTLLGRWLLGNPCRGFVEQPAFALYDFVLSQWSTKCHCVSTKTMGGTMGRKQTEFGAVVVSQVKRRGTGLAAVNAYLDCVDLARHGQVALETERGRPDSGSSGRRWQQFGRQQQPRALSWQRDESEVRVEAGCGFILGVDDDSGDREHCAGLGDFSAGVGDQNRTESRSPDCGVDSEPADQRHRNRVAGQFAREFTRQIGAGHAASAQGEETSQLPRVAIRRRDKYPRDVSAHILRGIAAYVIIESVVAAVEFRRVYCRIQRTNAIDDQRLTCAVWRL